MTYTPNIKDPRVLKRMRTAYAFTRAFLKKDIGRECSRDFIDKYFGDHSNELSKWLRNVLLECTNPNYSMYDNIAKSYKYKPIGIEYISNVLNNKTRLSYNHYTRHRMSSLIDVNYESNEPDTNNEFDYRLVSEMIVREVGDQLKTKQFIYEEKSHRLWNPLQHIRKEYKTKIFHDHGLSHSYDIETCAPTLIHQYSMECGMDEYLFALNDYLNDKNTYRQYLSDIADIDINTSKIIINALFCGAKLGANDKFAIFNLLGNNKKKMEILSEDVWLKELIKDIRTCWINIMTGPINRYQYINNKSVIVPIKERTNRPGITIKFDSDNKKIRISSRDKWNIYFKLERHMLNNIRKYLDNNKMQYFLEHDGFQVNNTIDTTDLQDYIRNNTNYNLKFSYHYCG
jgi:hypothetical protein